MAASKSCYRYLTGVGVGVDRQSPESFFEFDESDVWSTATSPSTELRSTVPRRKISPAVKVSVSPVTTVPMNVPEKQWNCDDDVYGGGDDVYGGGGGRSWVPPHEYLARTRIASFSVQEGKGRTLKGRDLRRVRNAIWEKTGFQD